MQLLGKDSIAVVNEKTIVVVRRNGFSQLLERPLSRRVLSHIDMNDAPRVMLYHNQHVSNVSRAIVVTVPISHWILSRAMALRPQCPAC